MRIKELPAICGGEGISTDWADAETTGNMTSSKVENMTRKNRLIAMGPFNVKSEG